jgi:uncharacterized protein YqjF (DUF2071 family)
MMTQTWHDLLFEKATRQGAARVDLDLFDGTGWLPVVPFRAVCPVRAQPFRGSAVRG